MKDLKITDLAGMESLSTKNKSVKYLLFVIDDFTKYACIRTTICFKRQKM